MIKENTSPAATAALSHDTWSPIDFKNIPLDRPVLIVFKNPDTGYRSISTCIVTMADEDWIDLPIMSYSVDGRLVFFNRISEDAPLMDATWATHWMEIPLPGKGFSAHLVPLDKTFLIRMYNPKTKNVLLVSAIALHPSDERMKSWTHIFSDVTVFFSDDDEDLLPVRKDFITHWTEMPELPLDNAE